MEQSMMMRLSEGRALLIIFALTVAVSYVVFVPVGKQSAGGEASAQPASAVGEAAVDPQSTIELRTMSLDETLASVGVQQDVAEVRQRILEGSHVVFPKNKKTTAEGKRTGSRIDHDKPPVVMTFKDSVMCRSLQSFRPLLMANKLRDAFEAMELIKRITRKHRDVFVDALLPDSASNDVDAWVTKDSSTMAQLRKRAEETPDFHDALIALQLIVERRRANDDSQPTSEFSDALDAIRLPASALDLEPEAVKKLPPGLRKRARKLFRRVDRAYAALRALSAAEEELLSAQDLLAGEDFRHAEVTAAMKVILGFAIETPSSPRVFCAPLMLLAENPASPNVGMQVASDGLIRVVQERRILNRQRTPFAAKLHPLFTVQDMLLLQGATFVGLEAAADADAAWKTLMIDTGLKVSGCDNEFPLAFAADGVLHPQLRQCLARKHLLDSKGDIGDFMKLATQSSSKSENRAFAAASVEFFESIVDEYAIEATGVLADHAFDPSSPSYALQLNCRRLSTRIVAAAQEAIGALKEQIAAIDAGTQLDEKLQRNLDGGHAKKFKSLWGDNVPQHAGRQRA